MSRRGNLAATINSMRTRALFYIVFAGLILAALLVLDLVAHSYTAIQGAVLELVRAGLAGCGHALVCARVGGVVLSNVVC